MDPFTGQYVNHQVFVKKPRQPQVEKKDPDVWDPPTPQMNAGRKPAQNKWGAKKKLQMQKPASGGGVAQYGAGMAPNIKNIGPQVKKLNGATP